ncbi:hypothetical protein [uncultured Christiangramia sp.]|uniref:hypothetical protein n=1 Tax=uncultured Christiangramia sp. TaxID=503836 RepID=UPI0026082A3A|nr:hypothetical protein [uncultured Christiangramia sp.]
MRQRHYYLELKDGDKVLKRKPTSLASERNDRLMLQEFQKFNQEIFLVISSEKEKVIL